jgi:hypothetical protein
MHKLSIDSVPFATKPAAADVKQISIRIKACELGLAELASLICSGYTICPSTFRKNPQTGRAQRLDALFEQSSLILLDFDKGIPDFTNPQYMPALVYHSFSSTPETPKGRALFALSNPITDLSTYRHLVQHLLEVFPAADRACKDSSRLFYGSNRGPIAINPKAILNIDTLLSEFPLPAQQPAKTHTQEWAPSNSDEEEQKLIFARMTPGRRKANLQYVERLLARIESLDASSNESRYQVVSNVIMTLVARDYLIPSVVRGWVLEAIEGNRYFDNWDHDPHTVVNRAYKWALTKRG